MNLLGHCAYVDKLILRRNCNFSSSFLTSKHKWNNLTTSCCPSMQANRNEIMEEKLCYSVYNKNFGNLFSNKICDDGLDYGDALQSTIWS